MRKDTQQTIEQLLDGNHQPPVPGRRSKYRNIRTEVDGIKFDSKREAHRFTELNLMRRAGEVLWFIRQPSFDLEGGVKYRADFLVVWKGGRVGIEDVKGMKTAVYKLKRKQVEARYGIVIEEKR